MMLTTITMSSQRISHTIVADTRWDAAIQANHFGVAHQSLVTLQNIEPIDLIVIDGRIASWADILEIVRNERP